MKNLENEEDGLPYSIPQPIDPDTAHDVLYPTSFPSGARTVDLDDGPLLPPWVRSGNEDNPPLLDS